MIFDQIFLSIITYIIIGIKIYSIFLIFFNVIIIFYLFYLKKIDFTNQNNKNYIIRLIISWLLLLTFMFYQDEFNCSIIETFLINADWISEIIFALAFAYQSYALTLFAFFPKNNI